MKTLFPVWLRHILKPLKWLALAFLLVCGALIVTISIPERGLSRATYEAAFRTNLQVIRDAIRDYRDTHGRGPRSLQELVEEHYFRHVPVDPIHGNRVTWVILTAPDGTVVDVRSASEERALDGSYYKDW